MRPYLALALVAACSSKGTATSHITDDVALPPGVAAVAKLVPASVTTVSRSTADGPILKLIGALGHADQQSCWQALVKKLDATWSLGNIHTDTTAMVLVGDLPRAEVEACITTVFAKTALPVTVGTDGTHATFSVTQGGQTQVLYAHWQDGVMIAGTKAAVLDVLEGPRATAAWAPRLARLAGTKSTLALASIDPITTQLLDIPTDGYDLTLVSSSPAVATAVIYARSPADADRVAKKIVLDDIKWPSPPPPELDVAIKTLVPKVTDREVMLVLEEKQFAKVPREALARVGAAILGAH